MSSSVNMSAAASTGSAAAKRGRPSDSSTPGNEEPDTDISPKNKRSRVIFVDPTESPQVSYTPEDLFFTEIRFMNISLLFTWNLKVTSNVSSSRCQ